MSPKRASGRTRFEIGVLVASSLACAAILGGLIWAEVAGVAGPADLRVSVERAPQPASSGGVPYTVRIRNVGGETAENVVVRVSLGDQERQLDILSVARADEEFATVIFPPGSTGTPEAEVESFHATTRG